MYIYCTETKLYLLTFNLDKGFDSEKESKSGVTGFMRKYVLKKDNNGDKPKKNGNFIDRFFDDKCLENSICSRQCLDILKVIWTIKTYKDK